MSEAHDVAFQATESETRVNFTKAPWVTIYGKCVEPPGQSSLSMIFCKVVKRRENAIQSHKVEA